MIERSINVTPESDIGLIIEEIPSMLRILKTLEPTAFPIAISFSYLKEAAIEGNPGIVVGNVVGSNICNIALILGVAALISPMQIKTQVVRREIPILIIITLIFLLLFVLLDFTISRITGVLFVIGIIAYIIFGYNYALNEKSIPYCNIIFIFKGSYNRSCQFR